MKDEYDFSSAERGKFFRRATRLLTEPEDITMQGFLSICKTCWNTRQRR